ncbi:MAG TPA: hypothetical protein VGF71_13715 [Caulobacteraceae bacterium]|jgi:hypothetical protein
MWRWGVLAFVIAAAIAEGATMIARYGADVNHFDFSGPCAFRSTDHWGWLESKSDQADAKTLRVLFVGDSLTYVNDLPGMLVRVASSDPTTPSRLEVRSVTAPNASLSNLWDQGCGLSRLKTDHYDVAVLQEHSYFWYPEMAEPAREAAGRWISAVRSFGARPIYFEPWTDEDDPYSDKGEALEAAQDNAKMYGADIARVGEAFAQARVSNGAPNLFASDHHHPSEAGSWLAALVIFHGLTGEPTERVTWRPAAVTPDQAATLERIADQYG